MFVLCFYFYLCFIGYIGCVLMPCVKQSCICVCVCFCVSVSQVFVFVFVYVYLFFLCFCVLHCTLHSDAVCKTGVYVCICVFVFLLLYWMHCYALRKTVKCSCLYLCFVFFFLLHSMHCYALCKTVRYCFHLSPSVMRSLYERQ